MPVGGHTGTNALLFGSLSGAQYAAYTRDEDGGKQAGRRRGAVKKRTQWKNPLTKTSTKCNKVGGQFMAVKNSAKKFKGVRWET
jgi:hypothetical protein